MSGMAAHHDHHEHSGASLINEARNALVESGEQWTEMRADVFTALADRERPASAYDLAESVSALRGKRVAPNSVYRILDLFVRTNLARRVESANAYVANSHPGCQHDCIFLICDSCGQAVHIDDDKLTGALVTAAKGAGFADVRPVVELRGICAECG
ncbi:transcriptional repressor [Novosphingobium sp. FGD1]|jgi:Fur family zinc uptake transcriptional regulator|uniref:Transcriptional repressor n=2 Tax=Novosphingobium silvae TaxID=2692619 RepID=A0A7X4GKY6_9SPHN|nr:transcriptional repressor [Novosphingobium silvae]MYL99617.1 transcriptional repressor [Novosphingobium silvae]